MLPDLSIETKKTIVHYQSFWDWSEAGENWEIDNV
jgi:hypothetical protein